MGGTLVASVVAALMVVPMTPALADTVPSFVAQLGGPLHAEFYASGLEVEADGNIVIADTGNNQIAKYTPSGTQIWRVGSPGSGVNQFLRPRDVSVSSNGTIFVVDAENDRIVRLGPDGSWLGVLNTTAQFFLGGSFKNDKYYLADIQHHVRVFDVAGNELQVINENGVCTDMFDIRDATADSAGRVYVANYDENAIDVFAPDGTCLFKFGSTGTGNGQFKTPYGVATGIDPVLGAEVLYVADAQNNRVQVFRLDGTFVGKFGTVGQATQPGTLYTLRRVSPALDGSGDVWVADLWGWRIERWHRTAIRMDLRPDDRLGDASDDGYARVPRAARIGRGLDGRRDRDGHDPSPVRPDESERNDRQPLRHARLRQRAVQLAAGPRYR